MFKQALDSFGEITLNEVLAFLVPFLLAIWVDLRSHHSGKAITMGDAARWSVIWIICALIFGAFVWWERGPEAASLYVTGYVLEKALAVDNLFAFFLIFKSFGLILEQNQPLQHRILYWGILGAIVFRILFLGAGAFVVNLSPYILIIFALIVLWTVYKMWQSGEEDEEASPRLAMLSALDWSTSRIELPPWRVGSGGSEAAAARGAGTGRSARLARLCVR
jgi:tellurite resistance protein TerC